MRVAMVKYATLNREMVLAKTKLYNRTRRAFDRSKILSAEDLRCMEWIDRMDS